MDISLPDATDPNLEISYESIFQSIESLVEGEIDLIACLSNITAVLKEYKRFWWVGFYLVKEGELVLGPFQGPVACTRIPFHKGVCGAAYSRRQTIVVDEVDQFPGHIACSANSKSELVIPIFHRNRTEDMEIVNHKENKDCSKPENVD